MDTPTSKSHQAKEIIKQHLVAGRWVEFLPSERLLASELMISRACLRQALELLTTENIISAPTSAKKRKILSKALSKSLTKPQTQVIFLTLRPETEATVPTLLQISEIRSILAKSQQSFIVASPSFFQHEKVTDSTIQKFTENYPNAHWVLHQSPEHVQRWFEKSSLPCFILGSSFPGISLPFIDLDFRSACRHATGHLIANGHRKIGLLLFRTQLAGDENAKEGMLDAIESSSFHDSIPKPLVIRHNFHCDNLANSLDKIYSKTDAPTALICTNDHHFLTTFTHLQRRGIRVPEDVSLIRLTSNPEFKFLQPTPTYYSSEKKRRKAFSRHFVSNERISNTLITPDMVQGQSVCKAPATK